ncbi:hypothetical protein OG285_23845 [Streptomyces sp. NBC_01471]|uniref:hypothetical protein n=1 Tax=Streptomyces sp. NBC_01471 TaxID=2903879 RepID=UPI003243183C
METTIGDRVRELREFRDVTHARATAHPSRSNMGRIPDSREQSPCQYVDVAATESIHTSVRESLDRDSDTGRSSRSP